MISGFPLYSLNILVTFTLLFNYADSDLPRKSSGESKCFEINNSVNIAID